MSNQTLSIEFEALKNDLIKAYDAKGMRASGKWAEGLEVVIEPNRATLLGLEYSQQLETGRKSGKQPPSEAIEQWIYDKGIANQIQNKISVSSLAYLIARKIGREGWKREEYGSVELISEIVTDERIQRIIDEVGNSRATAFATDIIILLKELENAA